MANTVQSDLETENDSEALKSSLLEGQKASLANELPAELLVHIFEMAQNVFFPLEQHSSWRFPLILGEVSRYWRQVAYGAPTLWSSVDVALLRDLGGLQVYLRRSKDTPIDLDITFTPALQQRGVDTLIGILQPHYRRCRSIRVEAEASYEFTTEISSILDSMCKGHYPMLQHICVEGSSDIRSCEQLKFAMVPDAVNLTSVWLRGLGFKFCRPPLTAVTQLHLAPSTSPLIRYADFSEMLRSCRSLVTLCVYDNFLFEWPTPFYDHDMPFLRYIRLLCCEEVSQVLLSICAPSLEGLTIAPIIQQDLTKLERATSDSPRFPTLKSLTLAPAYADSVMVLVDVANACFPGIKLLIVPNYDKLSDSFKMTDSRPFWPELDGLAVRDIHDQGVLYEFVQHRQRLGVPLRSLYLDPLSMSRMTRMDWLKDQLSVVEADPWKTQREDSFYRDEETRFLEWE